MRKPLEGAVAENVLKYDTGALNLGGCRVRVAGEEEGRWAANLILEHLPDCSRGQGGSVEACVVGCPVRRLDEQSGSSMSSGGTSADLPRRKGLYEDGLRFRSTRTYSDGGGASRYFEQVGGTSPDCVG